MNEEPEHWDQRILARIDSGVDVSQLKANLKLTPTERIEKMESWVAEMRELRGDPRAS
ncbi:MAG: hypothetical protein AAF411_17390 [Myxococcota bacterium]